MDKLIAAFCPPGRVSNRHRPTESDRPATRRSARGKKLPRRHLVAGAMALAWLVGPAALVPAQAQGISLIRDAEIESTIRAYAEPLWTAAGLNAPFVQVHLINDD